MKMLMFVGLVISTLIACSAKTDDSVREIHQELARIQSDLSTLQKTQRILLGISTEGAAVTAYSEKGNIQKIAVEALGETGKYLADFYFKNEQIIFSHIKVINYGSHIMETHKSEDLKERVAEEDRFYFANGKLIQWLKFEEHILSSKPGYQEKGQSVLAEAQSFVLLMKTSPPKAGEDFCNWICGQKENERCVKYQCE